MKNSIAIFLTIIGGIIIIIWGYSCYSNKYIKIIDIYPEHFQFFDSLKLPTNYLPQDIYNSLPDEFKLANDLGYLNTFIFSDASLKITKLSNSTNGNLLFIESDSVKNIFKKYSKLHYNLFMPLKFPHVICVYPKINLVEDFENESSIDLVEIILQYHQYLKHNNELGVKIKNVNSQILKQEIDSKILSSDIQIGNTKLKILDDSILNLQNKVKILESEITNENQIQSELINKLNSGVNFTGSSASSTSTGINAAMIENYKSINIIVNEWIESYRDELDDKLFKDIYDKEFTSIKDKPYNTPNTDVKGFSVLDERMANALDKLFEAVNNPDIFANNNPTLSQEDRVNLNIMQSSSIQIVSASRSPVHQLALTNPDKAKILDSKHMSGLAADLQFNGKVYNTANSQLYNTLIKVANLVGLTFTKPGHKNESNHIVLSEALQPGFNQVSSLQKLLSAFNSELTLKINQELIGINLLNGQFNSSINELSNLQKDVKNKSEQLKNINSGIQNKQNSINGLNNLISDKINELNSVKAKNNSLREQKEEQDRNRRNREGSRHERPDKPDRPERSLPDKPKSDKPKSDKPDKPKPDKPDKPKPDKPKRDRDPNIGPGGLA